MTIRYQASFTAALLAGVSMASIDFDLEKAIMKNLKWIRPPVWEHMPEDIDEFFNQNPKSAPEFSTKPGEEGHEEAAEHHDGEIEGNRWPPKETRRGDSRWEAGEYYDEREDKRYIYPKRADDHHYSDRRYEREYPEDKNHGEGNYPYRTEAHSRYHDDDRYDDHRYSDYDHDDIRYDDRDFGDHRHESRGVKANDENDEAYNYYKQREPYPMVPGYGQRRPMSGYGQRRQMPVHRETEEEREAREHFEFGARYGIQAPHYAPESHRRDPWDEHYDPYSPYYDHHSEIRPHWTDDDEGYTMDFARQHRDVFTTKRKSKKDTKKDKSKK